jgi:hypothetical protein
MLEIIHAATGGGLGIALTWALIKRPQVLTAIPQVIAAILALIVAPFPGERTYGRYKEMAGLPSTGESPAKKTPQKKAKRKK